MQAPTVDGVQRRANAFSDVHGAGRPLQRIVSGGHPPATVTVRLEGTPSETVPKPFPRAMVRPERTVTVVEELELSSTASVTVSFARKLPARVYVWFLVEPPTDDVPPPKFHE